MPYAIESSVLSIPESEQYAGGIFALIYAAFGAVMIGFLMFEPLGLVGIWDRLVTRYYRRRLDRGIQP